MDETADGDTVEPNVDDPFVPWYRGEDEASASLAASHERSRHRRRVAATVGVAAIVVLATVAITIGASGPGSTDAAAFVAASARDSLSQRTVDLVVSGTVTVAGQSLGVSGTGEADLSTRLASLDLTAAVEGQSLLEREILSGTDTYLSIVINGANQVSKVVPGKNWVLEPNLGVASSSTSSANPFTELQLLEQRGDTVVSLGPSSIDGQTVKGFRVTFSATAFRAAAEKIAHSTSLNTAARQILLKSLSSIAPPVIEVFIGADDLLRRESVSLSFTQSGVTAGGNITIDFVHYGVPVSIAIPAASEVASFNEFATAGGTLG